MNVKACLLNLFRSATVLLFLMTGVAPLLAKTKGSLEAPIQFYLIERTGNGSNVKISFSKTKALFLKQFHLAGFHVAEDLEPPFVSKSMVRYGAGKGTNASSGIGYVHLSLTDDDQTHYLSDAGAEVTLKSDPSKVVWIFEPKRALEMADEAGVKYALVVEVTTQMVYQDNSPKPVYQVALNANLFDAHSGKVVFHYAESMVKLADTMNKAILGACQFLSPQLAQKLRDAQFDSALN